VFCTLFICWGALAGLYHNYGVQKHCLNKKLYGVLPYRCSTRNDPLLRGFDDVFYIPQSRYATVRKSDIAAIPSLHILAESCAALYPHEMASAFGNDVFVMKSADSREVFVTGHLEYETGTLSDEYLRDSLKGLKPALPLNYFPNNDPQNAPRAAWRSCAHLFFSNWLNYYVYQATPFEFV
jgi:homoserine O-succinyltransferase